MKMGEERRKGGTDIRSEKGRIEEREKDRRKGGGREIEDG